MFFRTSLGTEKFPRARRRTAPRSAELSLAVRGRRAPSSVTALKTETRRADLWNVGGTLLDEDRGNLASLPARRRPFQRLSSRELEILELVADGLGNREIAEQLQLSEETVKTHLRRLMRKLGATSRAHAVALGIRSELIR